LAFIDHFSEKSDLYARARPTYPDALFDFIASRVPERDRAWDCATGSGQAARGLARHFGLVEATDASGEQIARGRRRGATSRRRRRIFSSARPMRLRPHGELSSDAWLPCRCTFAVDNTPL
jgi:hypothetical protein